MTGRGRNTSVFFSLSVIPDMAVGYFFFALEVSESWATLLHFGLSEIAGHPA